MSNHNDTPSNRQTAPSSGRKFVWETPAVPVSASASASQRQNASRSGPKFVWNTPTAPLVAQTSQQQNASSFGSRLSWNTPTTPSTTSASSNSGSRFVWNTPITPSITSALSRQEASSSAWKPELPNDADDRPADTHISDEACPTPVDTEMTEDVSMENAAIDASIGDASASAMSQTSPIKEQNTEASGAPPTHDTSNESSLPQHEDSSAGTDLGTIGSPLAAEPPACGTPRGTPCPQSGRAGEVGEAGEAGEAGETGETGEAGEAGEAGESDDVQAVRSRLERTSFDKVKRRFLRQQSQGRQAFADPILRIFDMFETTAIARLTASDADSSSVIDLFTFPIGHLCLRDIVPLALYRDDHRSWFEDVTINFLVEDARRRLNIDPGVAYISAGFNGIFFGANMDHAYSPGEIRARLDAEVAHLSRFGTLENMTWPFEANLTGVKKVVMACNTGSHWYCVLFSYDRASLICTIDVYDSSPTPQERLRGLMEYLPSFARLLSMSTAVAMPNVQGFKTRAHQPYRQNNSIDCGPLTAYSVIYLMALGYVPVQSGNTRAFGRRIRHLFLGSAYEYIMEAKMTETFADEQEGPESDDEEVINVDDEESRATHPSEAEVAKLQQRLQELKNQRTRANQTLVDLGIEVIEIAIKGLQPLPISFGHILLCMPDQWYSETLIDAAVRRSNIKVSENALYIPTALTGSWLSAERHEMLERAHAMWSDQQTMHRHFKIVPKEKTVPEGVEFVVFAWCYANHWFAVQAASSSGSIKVYDSNSTHWSKKMSGDIKREAERTLPMYMALVSAQAGWQEHHWTVAFEESMQQQDGSACGPITVENCLSLLAATSPGGDKVLASNVISMRIRHLNSVVLESLMECPNLQKSKGSGPITELTTGQQNIIGNHLLLNHNINYVELICNTLQTHPAGLTLDKILDGVRTQIARHFGLPSDWSADDGFDHRILSYLDREGSLSFEKDDERWHIRRGVARNMSTSEKSRLASAKPILPVTGVRDQLNTDYDLIIVIDRKSRWTDTSASPRRCEDLIEGWWRRFGPTDQMPAEYDGTQGLQSLSSPAWVQLCASRFSSNNPLLDLLKKEENVERALNHLNQRGGVRVLMLQANMDGSSDDPDSFRPVLDTWQGITWDLMIVTSLDHTKSSKVPEGLYGFALQDHDKLHTYSLYWFQASLSGLADLWQYGPTENRSQAQMDLDMSHEHILHMMVMAWYYKSDPDGVLSPTRIVPERQNYTTHLMLQRRRTFELGSPRKVCFNCQAISPFRRWLRGPPELHHSTGCERLRLRCDSSTCVSATDVRTEHHEDSSLYQLVLEDLMSEKHSRNVESVPEFVNGQVRVHILASEGSHSPKSNCRRGKRRINKYKREKAHFLCDPCRSKFRTNGQWYQHLTSKKHREACGGRLSNPPQTDAAAWKIVRPDQPGYHSFREHVCPFCGSSGKYGREHFECPRHVAWINRRVEAILKGYEKMPE